MKISKIFFYLSSVYLLCICNSVQGQLTFTINNLSNSYSITCFTPTINLVTTSNYSAPVSYNWINQQSVTIVSNSLTVSSPNSYTITATSGSIFSTQTLAIGINTTIPTLTLTSSANAITCSVPAVQLLGSSTPSNVNYAWITSGIGQPCSTNTCVSSIAGTYTLIVTDLLNGCFTSSTISIIDNRFYPLFGASTLYTVSCPDGSVTLTPSIITSTTGLTFKWHIPLGAITSVTNAAVLITDASGEYTLIATNSLNGCSSKTFISVWACVGIGENVITTIKLFPNPITDKLYIKFESKKIEIDRLIITNNIGQTIFILNSLQFIEEIDLSFLTTGIYFLTLQSDPALSVFKIVKK